MSEFAGKRFTPSREVEMQDHMKQAIFHLKSVVEIGSEVLPGRLTETERGVLLGARIMLKTLPKC